MHFVEDVDLPSSRRSVPGAGNDLTDGVDSVVGRGVEFDHIKGRPFGNGNATGTRSTGVTVVGILTVESLGENARGGRLSRSARPGKEVGVRDTVVFDRSLQGAYHVILAAQFGETPRAITPV